MILRNYYKNLNNEVMEKKMIQTDIGEMFLVDTDYVMGHKQTPISDLIEFLQESTKNGATHVCFDGETDYDDRCDLTELDIKAVKIREESNAEYSKRTSEAELKRQTVLNTLKEKRRLEYENLKKEFE